MALAFVIVLVMFPFTANIVAAKPLNPLIYDDAGLLKPSEKKELEALALQYTEKWETDFILLTTNDPGGKDVEKYMGDFYDTTYGQRKANAAILAVDMKSREIYLSGFYKGKKYLTPERLDTIRNKIIPAMENGKYAEVFETFILSADAYMGEMPGIFFQFGFQVAVSIGMGILVVGAMLLNFGGKVTVNSRTYIDSNRSRVLKRRDVYLRTSVTKRRKPTNNSSGGGGGGRTGGGHSYSGSRGSF